MPARDIISEEGEKQQKSKSHRRTEAIGVGNLQDIQLKSSAFVRGLTLGGAPPTNHTSIKTKSSNGHVSKSERKKNEFD